jgi:sugar phosphate isomerase/epimerase
MTASSTIGYSSYAFFWRGSADVPNPMSLHDMLRATAADGVRLFQICDYPAIEVLGGDALAELRALADELGIALELGTRGTQPAQLELYLILAAALGATLVRSMWTAGDDRPSASEAETRLRAVLPLYEAAGVRLALETYEQVATTELIALIERVGSANLGICLDPANTVANLESPTAVVGACAPHVINWHVKDFDFSRAPGWVGFALQGAPLGTGRLEYDHFRAIVRPHERGINQIIEHWLPWQGDAETTIRLEAEWTESTLHYLRSSNK